MVMRGRCIFSFFFLSLSFLLDFFFFPDWELLAADCVKKRHLRRGSKRLDKFLYTPEQLYTHADGAIEGGVGVG
jgi:hypothetical protein